MRRVVLLGASVALALWASACADLRERTPASASERVAAQRVVAQGRALAGLVAHQGAGQLVDATDLIGVAALVGQADVPGPGGPLPELGACAAREAGAVKFTGCELAGHTIDGSISRMGATLRAELTDVFLDGYGREGAATVDGAFAAGTDRILHGTIDLYAVWSTHEGGEASLDAELTFDRVLLAGDGCPVGGMLHVGGRRAAAPAARTFFFGPACGEVTVAP